MCAESPASGARFVGRFRIVQDSLPKTDVTANLMKFLHITQSLATILLISDYLFCKTVSGITLLDINLLNGEVKT